MKQQPRADLYSDYLLAAFGATTAPGLSQLLEGEVSHDQVTRYLAGTKKTAADLWLTVKSFVRQVQFEPGVLIIDDSLEEKPYTDEKDLGCWHYDHSKDRLRKGSNFLTALYASHGVSLPVGFHLVAQTETDLDPKTQKEKRRSPVTKHEACRELLKQAVTNLIPFRFVVFAVWFAAAETLVSSDTTLSVDDLTTTYHTRWQVACYHKSLKQKVSLAKSPTQTVTTQTNHFFAALCGFIKLERLKVTTTLNHFAL